MTAIGIAHSSVPYLHREPAQAKSGVHRLALVLVAITIGLSGIVLAEPAPVDALTIALVILLPTIGLVAVNPTLLCYFSLWAIAGAAAVLAATFSLDLGITLTHVGITLYLYLATVLFAAFVATSPARHTELIFKAWTWAALAAAVTGLLGYFALVPGAYDLFTKFGRASGSFKDPNVFGPFLVVPLLYMVHVALERAWHRMFAPLALAGMFTLTVLVTFSRGAWMNLVLALVVFGYLTLLTSRRATTRIKVIALLVAGVLFAATLIVIAVNSDYISDLFVERASLEMSYDTGSQGRFGGQQKALGLIAENPLGIGAEEFTTRHHPEEVHNVYLSMLLNAGWLGGGVYWILVGLTLVLGFRHAMKATETRPLFLIAYSAFVAVALEGLIVDTDHWRHFYLLMAIIWGLMSAGTVAEPVARAAFVPRRRPRTVVLPCARWPAQRRRLPRIFPRVLRDPAS